MNKQSYNDLFLNVFGWILSKDNEKYSTPIKKAYLLGVFFFLLPEFGRHKKGNSWVIGSKIFLSDGEFQKFTLISTPKDVLKIKKIPVFFGQFYRVYSLLYLSLIFKNKYFVCKAFNIINNSMVKYSPALVVINSTKDPFNRLMAIVANIHNIKTVCVQHGLFSPAIPDEVNEDDLLDLYFAINQNQKNIISRKINHKKIKILSNSLENKSGNVVAATKICLVGEDWERYGDLSKKNIIINFYLSLIEYVRSKNLNDLIFHYRPHPSERELLGVNKVIQVALADAEQYDLFIGFSSTFLWDMALKNRPCLQVHSPLITEIDFQVDRICASIKLDDLVFDRVLDYIKNPEIKYKINKNNIFEMMDM